MSEKGNEEFSFIEEKIKNKPVNKRRIMMQLIKTAGLAVVFGVIVCFVFCMLQLVMS